MTSTLQVSFPACAFGKTWRSFTGRKAAPHSQTLCFSVQSNNLRRGEDEVDSDRERVILVERYANGTAKRYVLDDTSKLKSYLEEGRSESNRLRESHLSGDIKLSWLPDTVLDFILPAGFPGSVSDDYLQYMLLQFPTNVTGWICHALVTSSLLKACSI
ncbi:hypothetical protein Tsubulata_023102 [Turnera subulata]|uniref:Protein root UVB sensitive/RUS domain-containing protein n=1 Tax=Turnera subulata TaxID=218843 RepID=A0A9Q0J268_9ROSI|nr:hypothetical protein Tsubulata_023102 [Turnera subulata]